MSDWIRTQAHLFTTDDASGTVFIQWKGTDASLDFYCDCGAQGHFDGYFAYALKCGECGTVWELPSTLTMTKKPEYAGNIEDPEMGERWK